MYLLVNQFSIIISLRKFTLIFVYWYKCKLFLYFYFKIIYILIQTQNYFGCNIYTLLPLLEIFCILIQMWYYICYSIHVYLCLRYFVYWYIFRIIVILYIALYIHFYLWLNYFVYCHNLEIIIHMVHLFTDCLFCCMKL